MARIEPMKIPVRIAVETEWADVDTWLTYGKAQGWASHPVCATHDGIPSTTGEDAEWDDGGDPCQHIVRLWSREDV